MNRQDYRAAFDAVDFSPDFEERTLQKLAAMRQASEKEQIIMPMNRVKKTALLIAAAVALLAVSVSAAVEGDRCQGTICSDGMFRTPKRAGKRTHSLSR